MQSIASLNLVSNCMPYKMGFYENKKGKSIGQVHPSEVCFQSNIGSFLRTDIYCFVGVIGNIDSEDLCQKSQFDFKSTNTHILWLVLAVVMEFRPTV
jgi:hypothetical protein